MPIKWDLTKSIEQLFFFNSLHRAFYSSWDFPSYMTLAAQSTVIPLLLSQGLLNFLGPLVIIDINTTHMLLNTGEAKHFLKLITQQQVLILFPGLILRTLSKEFSMGQTVADAAWVITIISKPFATTPAASNVIIYHLAENGFVFEVFQTKW